MADDFFSQTESLSSTPTQDFFSQTESLSSTPTQDFFSIQEKTKGSSDFFGDLETRIGQRTTVTVDDPDSFSSRLGRSFNEFQKSFAEGVGVFGREMDNEALQNWSEESITNQQRDIESYGTPTRTSSFSEGIGEISEEDNLGEAISRSGLLAKDMLADALGSVGVPLALGLAAIPLAAVVGTAAATTFGLIAPFVAGGLAGAGEIKKEAEKLGASPEDADNYALAGGAMVGLLERVGAGIAIKSLVKEFGKDAVVKEFSKEVGKKTAKTAVDKALDISKDVLVRGTKAGLGEAITEAMQEAVQISASGIAADKGLVPYEGAEIGKRLIDAAALGFMGGKAVNVGGTILSKTAHLQANRRQEELEKELKRAEETLSDSKTELYKPLSEGKKGNINKLTNIIRRSTTPLVDFANRDVRANRIVSKFNSFYDDSSADVGELGRISERAFKKIRRVLKVPVAMKDIPKKKMNDLYEVMTKNVISKDRNINEAAKILRNDLFGTREKKGSGIFGKLKEADIKVGYQEEYLPRVYKFGFGNKTLGKVFSTRAKKVEKILKNNKFAQEDIDEFIENIVDNDGMYIPEKPVTLDDPSEKRQAVSASKKSFESARKLKSPKIVKEMEDAGLIEKDVRKLANRYMLQASRRIRAQELKNEFNTHIPALLKEKKVSDKEIKHMQKVFASLQNSYSPIQSRPAKNINKFNTTYQYMLTLPLAAITSLTEPLFVLSRVSPKNAIFGGIDAAVNTMAKGLRTILPKLPKTKAEREFDSILQGFDASLSERLSHISGVDVPRRVTDKFFKAILLTQVTQVSRDIAFQATRRALKEDLLEVHKAQQAGHSTRGSQKAQRRLLEGGLVTSTVREPISNEIMNWVNDDTGTIDMPPIISKVMSKTTDEIIMSPNAVNRPIWMSNPHYTFAAQLKGFIMTIGNTVGYRLYKEVIKPVYTLRGLPVEEAFRYALAFSLIAAGTMGTKALKDIIRYGDEESPWEEKEPGDKFWTAIVDSNIFGPGTIVHDALRSTEYGVGLVEALLGPTVTWGTSIAKSMLKFLQGKPKSLARTLVLSVPILNQLKKETKEEYMESVEESIEDVSQELGDTLWGD